MLSLSDCAYPLTVLLLSFRSLLVPIGLGASISLALDEILQLGFYYERKNALKMRRGDSSLFNAHPSA